MSRPNSFPGRIESSSCVSRTGPCLEFVSRPSSCPSRVYVQDKFVSVSLVPAQPNWCPVRIVAPAVFMSRPSSCPDLVRVCCPCPDRVRVQAQLMSMFATLNDAQIPTHRHDLNITDDLLCLREEKL